MFIINCDLKHVITNAMMQWDFVRSKKEDVTIWMETFLLDCETGVPYAIDEACVLNGGASWDVAKGRVESMLRRFEAQIKADIDDGRGEYNDNKDDVILRCSCYNRSREI